MKKNQKDTFSYIYQRTTCAKCNIPISKYRIDQCKKKKFWPVCLSCEPIVTKFYIEAQKRLAQGMANWYKQ